MYSNVHKQLVYLLNLIVKHEKKCAFEIIYSYFRLFASQANFAIIIELDLRNVFIECHTNESHMLDRCNSNWYKLRTKYVEWTKKKKFVNDNPIYFMKSQKTHFDFFCYSKNPENKQIAFILQNSKRFERNHSVYFTIHLMTATVMMNWASERVIAGIFHFCRNRHSEMQHNIINSAKNYSPTISVISSNLHDTLATSIQRCIAAVVFVRPDGVATRVSRMPSKQAGNVWVANHSSNT